VTELGLGTRFTEQTKNGLDWFYTEHARRAAMLASRPPGEGMTSREKIADRYQVQRSTEAPRNNYSYTGKDLTNGSMTKNSENSFSAHPSRVQKSVTFVA